MKIGELSERSGFSRDTIRYYQELGLLNGMVHQGENNYREFSEESVEVLQLIKESKIYGFTLKENKALLEIRNDNNRKLELMEHFLEKKIQGNKVEIERLVEQSNQLLNLKAEIHHCRDHCN